MLLLHLIYLNSKLYAIGWFRLQRPSLLSLTLKNLDESRAGTAGETEHDEAVDEQKKEEADQAVKNDEYRQKKRANDQD